MEQFLQGHLVEIMKRFGDLGVFIAMFLESSVVPIPSEVIIIGAGAIGIPMSSVLIFGSLGSTLGACVGWSLGRYGALPVILRIGKYILIKPHHIYKAEAFARKYGTWSVLIGRLLPIVPFKVFSIAAGITNIPILPFILYTLIGVFPRILLLTLFGAALVKYTKPVILVIFFALLIVIAVRLVQYLMKKNSKKKKNNV